MSISKHNLIKWYKMLTGKSILHVNQDIGQVYSKNDIAGYYNDLTEKVLKDKDKEKLQIPKSKMENGNEVIFPIAIFQYGLGSYDLFLITKEELYLDKFKLMVNWTMDNQEDSGAWNNFFYIYPEAPYSAMAQGEGVSLLLRAYIEFNEEKYLEAARKAIDFMLLSIEDGGTTIYRGDDIFLQECTNQPTVLNGWIFAIFGLYDYVKVSGDKNLKVILEKTLNTLSNYLPALDNKYWSMYNLDGMITSPFYHNLHIAQLNALYDLFGMEIFNHYSYKWKIYQGNWFNRKRAFLVKVSQKLSEK